MSTAIARILGVLYGVRRWLLNQSWFTSTLLPAIPRPIRWRLRTLYFLPSDLLERVVGGDDEMIPPKSQIYTGVVNEFADTGTRLVSHLVDIDVLAPDSKVLDVGSGMGALAVALLSYRGDEGSYDGIDIVPSGVDWCTTKIASKHQSFHFTLADIFNKEYNPTGHLRAAEYRFPYQDDTFDLVVLVSVFTHMLPEDMEHYISESTRVLKKGGHCYATFSLLDAEVLELMQAGKSQRHFTKLGKHWVVDTKVPELALAYEESFVRDLFERYGQSTRVRYGTWSCRTIPSDDSPRFEQDYVLATKS